LNEIFVWRRKSQQQFRMGGIAGGMLTFLQLFFVVAGGAFVYQNLAMFKFRM
jgi:hypothetical protein